MRSVDIHPGLKLLAGRCSQAVLRDGRFFFRQGRVEISEQSGAVFAAEVGEEYAHYSVRFVHKAGEVRYGCTCHYFEREKRCCAHVLAAALAGADSPMFCDALPKCKRIVLDPTLVSKQRSEDDLEDGEDDDYEDDAVDFAHVEDDEDRDYATYEVVIPAKPPGAHTPPRPASPGITWQTLQYGVAQSADPSALPEIRFFLFQQFDSRWELALGRRKMGARMGPLTPVGRHTDPNVSGPDRELLQLLKAARERSYSDQFGIAARLPAATLEVLLPRLAASGRCHLLPRKPAEELVQAWRLFNSGLAVKDARQHLPDGYEELLQLPTLTADGAGPWELELGLQLEEQGPGKARLAAPHYEVQARLVRGEQRQSLEQLRLANLDGKLLFDDGTVGTCNAGDAHWLQSLRAYAYAGAVRVPVPELQGFLNVAFGAQGASRLLLPASFERVTHVAAQPVLELAAPRGRAVSGSVFFDYGETRVSLTQPSNLVLLAENQALQRDRSAENSALAVLWAAGFERTATKGRAATSSDIKIATSALLPALRAALEAGFQVFAEGKRYRRLSTFDIQVESGLDWFEIQGAARFGETRIPLPQLLRQAARGAGTVELGDGSHGVLPADWLQRWGGLAELSTQGEESLRFSKRQVGIAEVLLGALSEQGNVPGLAELRQRVNDFYEVTPRLPPAGFTGSLRPYQAHGLSWLGALSDLGLGACLADDMGLGKTIQLLAHLAAQHVRGSARAPSLIVMPRSLLANWATETARFAPELRVHTHWGPDRGEVAEAFRDVDVVFTTYGTLRLDIAALAELELSTVVLDEAQAIKNERSATAKCARRLRAAHRIALSGTPIENHLGELWSLFEFLNPGMLAELPSLGRALDKQQASPETLNLIQLVLRPFILRRTKLEVAKELPERSEQTLFVDLEPEERAHYDQLLRFYQASIKKQGLTDPTRGTPHVLEALLRLRQAACHPGLIDRARVSERSSKVELLLEQLRGLVQEGHKALVFSQFTSLLGILRERLEEEKIAFTYLDGKTRDRDAAVQRFQNDPALSVFLVSLKAGGVGLNLTAADYVFILDPWWNPAVEAQAIDRAHRIGQKRPVIAYRLLARNTVEERVAQLQDQKRQLVAAVMGDEGAFTGKLTRGDLESLLGLGAD